MRGEVIPSRLIPQMPVCPCTFSIHDRDFIQRASGARMVLSKAGDYHPGTSGGSREGDGPQSRMATKG